MGLPFINLPVCLTGTGPIANNQACPTDADSYSFMTPFYDALEEKSKIASNNCDAEFPPPSVYWARGTTDAGAPTVNYTGGVPTSLTFTMTGFGSPVDPTGPCSGSTSRWAGYSCGSCLPNIPADYDLIVITDYDDAYTWIRLSILGNTYEPASDPTDDVTTITTEYLPAINAVTANFISSLSSLGNAQFRITKHRNTPGAGMTSRDRRPLKPNQQVHWRGNCSANSWVDASGNGVIQELTNTIDPSPYDTDGGALPAVLWSEDRYKNAEIMFFDSTGLLYRQTIGGNSQNIAGWGQSIYDLTVTAVSGFFYLAVNGSSLTIPYDATASDIEDAIDAVVSGATVTGSLGSFVVTFPAFGGLTIDTGGGASIGLPSGGTALSGAYIIVPAGAKGAPGRIPDSLLGWYKGPKQSYVTHNPGGGIGVVNKPIFNLGWSEGDVCSPDGCNDADHDCFGDCQFEVDNTCVGSQAGDWVAPDYWKCWRAIQEAALAFLGSFVDLWNPIGDSHSKNVLNMFTPATWAVEAISNYGISLGAYQSTLTVTGTGTGPYVVTVGLPMFPVVYPFAVYYTIQDAHQCNKASGTASIAADGTIDLSLDATYNGLAIFIWGGNTDVIRARHKYCYGKATWIPDCNETGCQDPPGVSVGGALDNPASPTLSVSATGGTLTHNTNYYYRISAVNGSGETEASTEVFINTTVNVGAVPIVTDLYSITLTWTPELGASEYNIYGRTSGAELLLATVSAYSGKWTDDGSLTPSGALPTSNTTSTDCFGVGLWNFRDRSQSHLSSTVDGFTNDGGGGDFVLGILSRQTTDNYQDAFSGRGPMTDSLDDEAYWMRFYRGKNNKSVNATYTAHMSGVIESGTLYSLFDPTATWWTDGVSDGTMRVQGGQLTAGGTATVTDSDYGDTGTSKSCWFEVSRFVGAFNGITSTPYSFFTMEIYSGGSPAGWSIVLDGTATYTAPTALGTSGTFTSGAPTISGLNPTLIHATGLPQPIFLEGDNFATGCIVTLTAPDSSQFSLMPTVTSGELTLGNIVFPRESYGTWHIVATNPVGHASSWFSFTVHQVQVIPIQSFSTGVFTLHGTLVTAATSSDFYLIREPKYECSKHAGRVVTITPLTGDPYQLVCRYSDNSSLYFDEQENPIVGNYAIMNIEPGAVLKLSSSPPTVASGLKWCEAPSSLYWVQPSGSDSRKSGAKFVSDINRNCENRFTNYGLISILSEYSYYIPNELYYMIISMQWTSYTCNWQLPNGCTPGASPTTDMYGCVTPPTTPINFVDFGNNTALYINYGAFGCSGPSDGTFATSITELQCKDSLAATCDSACAGLSDLAGSGLSGSNCCSLNAIPCSVFQYGASGNWAVAPPSGPWQGFLDNSVIAAFNYAHFSGLCNTFAWTAQCYVWGQVDSADTAPETTHTDTTDTSDPTFPDREISDVDVIFDAGGTPVLYHTWVDWTTASNGVGGPNDVYSSGPLGNLITFPTFPDPSTGVGNPTSGELEAGVSAEIGWYAGAVVAIIQWSLVYV